VLDKEQNSNCNVVYIDFLFKKSQSNQKHINV